MQTLRLFVLVLMCALLPLRGMGATLPCAAVEQQPATAAQAHHGQHDATVHSLAPWPGDGLPAHDGAGCAVDGETDQPRGSCDVCAAFCSGALLLLSAVEPPGALARAAALFPPFPFPPLSFLMEAQERPPRIL